MCIIKAASRSLAFLLSNKRRSWPLDTWEQSLQLQSQALRGRCWSKYAPRLPLQQPRELMAEAFLRAGKIKNYQKPVQPGSGRARIQDRLVSCELQIVQKLSCKEDGACEEDPNALFEVNLKRKGRLNKFKRLDFVLELVLPSPAPWHCWECQPGNARHPGNARECQPGRPEADTTFCWGPCVELLSAHRIPSVRFCFGSSPERSPRGAWMHREDAARGKMILAHPQKSQRVQTRSLAGSPHSSGPDAQGL